MKLSPYEQRQNRLIEMRAAHDADFRKTLEEQGIEMNADAQPIQFQIAAMAADQRQQIMELDREAGLRTGRDMTVYDRVLMRAEQVWRDDQERLQSAAKRRVDGQLDAAKDALANDRQERFDAIHGEVKRESRSYNELMQQSQDRGRRDLMREIEKIDPTINASERKTLADATVNMRPVPQEALALDRLSDEVLEVKRAHEREREREQQRSREKSPSASPTPSR